jgi:hypothetical protein
MPRLGKAILPRIRRSIQKHGLLNTAGRCLLGPYYLLQEYRSVQKIYNRAFVPDDFDVKHGVETTSRVHITDLKVDSANWVNVGGYWPTPTGLAQEALEGLPIRYQDFAFVDFGSGKGRVLMLASEFPFREIIGVEFSPELHAIAQQNIMHYRSATQKCRSVKCECMDFTQFPIPSGPMVAFMYNPSSEEIMLQLANSVAESFKQYPRELWVVYVTPTYSYIFESGKPLALRKIRASEKYNVYTNRSTP